MWEQLQSKSHTTKRNRSPTTVKELIPAKRSKSTKDHKKKSSQVIEESNSSDEEEPVPPPPSQYQFKPPPRVFRQQHEKGHNSKSFKVLEDSESDGDSGSDASNMVSSEGKESDLLEPEESVTQALFEEVPVIVYSDRHKNKQVKAVSSKVKVTSVRERKCAMETPRWNESVSTISEFDSPLVPTDFTCNTANAQSKEGYRDPMAHLVYTKTGVIQHGILELKAYIAFSHGYPEVIAKNTYARQILINATQYLKTEPIEKRMRTDKVYLGALVGLINARASLICGDIKETAFKNIAGYCHLGPNCSAILERLLPDHLYIFPKNFDGQGLPSPMFFKNMKSVDSQFPQQFLDIAKNKAHRPEIPISMLAIVCTVICAALLAKKNKSGEEFKFTGNRFCDNYNYHVSVLERLRETISKTFENL
ncbi:hypothetical protein BDR03DRAFT_1019344 [Suillus americanus]|nr:hypothetical protein BDR03DRAFT_1019344 [Suillus americanus]